MLRGKRKTEKGTVVCRASSQGGTEYILLHEMGEDEQIYSLLIKAKDGESRCFSDIARCFESARHLFCMFLREEVSVINADEVFEELLAREPSLFV